MSWLRFLGFKKKKNIVLIDNEQFGKIMKGLFLIKKDTSLIPKLQFTLVENIKASIDDELSKMSKIGKVISVESEEIGKDELSKPVKKVKIGKIGKVTEKLHERIDQVATSMIPQYIVNLLMKNENLSFSELLDLIGTSKPTLSAKLKELESEGKIQKKKVGRNTYYSLIPIKKEVELIVNKEEEV